MLRVTRHPWQDPGNSLPSPCIPHGYDQAVLGGAQSFWVNKTDYLMSYSTCFNLTTTFVDDSCADRVPSRSQEGGRVIYTFSFLPIFNHSKSSLLVSAKSSNSQAWYDWKPGFPVLNFPILVHQSIDSLDHCSLLWWLHPHEIDSKSPISWTHQSFSSCITIRFWLYHVIFTILVDYWWWIPNHMHHFGPSDPDFSCLTSAKFSIIEG